MTDVEKLEFLSEWLTDVGQVMRELRAAIQSLCEGPHRVIEATHQHPLSAD